MTPGIKTTEFWTTVISTLIVAASSFIGLPLDPTAVGSITAMVVTYTAGRVFTKNSEAKAQGTVPATDASK